MTVRRILGCAAAVIFAIALSPSSALAYEGDDSVLVVSDTNPAPGQPFNVQVDAGADSDEATLTVTSQGSSVATDDDDIEIAGTQSLTKPTNAGVARFTVTIHVEGRYNLVGFDAAGNRVGQSVVVVGDGVGGSGGGDEGAGSGAAGASAGASAGGGLPLTGVDGSTAIIGGAGLLLVAGGVALVASRRRTSQAA